MRSLNLGFLTHLGEFRIGLAFFDTGFTFGGTGLPFFGGRGIFFCLTTLRKAGFAFGMGDLGFFGAPFLIGEEGLGIFRTRFGALMGFAIIALTVIFLGLPGLLLGTELERAGFRITVVLIGRNRVR
jgi:hypothetical protein